jgi:predicted alpha/beta-hydrolase family hydrolase
MIRTSKSLNWVADLSRAGDAHAMNDDHPQKLTIEVGKSASVSALLTRPQRARACFVFAHGAGAGMIHPFMASVATGLAERGIATLRYQFPYMEKGSKRPDPPAVAHAAVRAAVAEASRTCPGLLIAGGKSFGGRMTSQAQAKAPLAGVIGLAFFGFPLHPAGKPSSDRADHLADVRVPMLFLQGTNDKLAELSLLKPVVARLGPRATLRLVEAADHSFHVPARSGRNDREIMGEVLDVLAAWIDEIEAKRA